MSILRPNIEKLQQAGDVPVLCKALRHRNSDVRQDAARALEELGDTQAVKALVGALQDDDIWVRRGAAQALSKLGDPSAVEPLIGALNDPDQYVRRAVAEALGELGDSRAVEPLGAALLGEPEMTVFVEAIEALAKFARRGEIEAVGPLLRARERSEFWGEDLKHQVSGALSEWSSTDSLLAALHAEHPATRSWAAAELGDLGDTQAVEPLIGALEDQSWGVQTSAAEGLGKLGDARAVQPLIAKLRDPEGEVGGKTAEALGMLGDPRAVEPLIGVLSQRGPDARQVLLALQKIGGPEAEEAISQCAPKVGDRVRVLVSGEIYAGMPGDRVEMGTGTVGEWSGKVAFVSQEGMATVRCEEVKGEVEGEAPEVGRIVKMRLHPGDSSELPNDPDHCLYEVKA